MRQSSPVAGHHQPLSWNAELRPDPARTTGPIAFLHPTRHHYIHRAMLHGDSDEEDQERGTVTEPTGSPGQASEDHDDVPKGEQEADSVDFKWTSRNNRKGRHEIDIVPVHDDKPGRYLVPESTSSLRSVLKNIGRMFTHYPVWDVSWLVAYVFTWGSVVWVINAFLVWLPLEKPSTEFPNEISVGGGVTAFIGATIFVIGSVLLMIEALNENKSKCFGWAVEKLLDDNRLRLIPDQDTCSHHHFNRRNLVGKAVSPKSPKDEATPEEQNGSEANDKSSKIKTWLWFPTLSDLRTHFLHELGFLACLVQLFAASIFWISGLTALPGIFNHLSPGLEAGIYWTPQVIGGTGFIISGILFMLETQEKWWLPALSTLGWHIGFWNTIGGLGFALCPAFGYDTASWAQYQASLSTFWGSWAFLIGSLIQLYESLQKHPVVVMEKKHEAKK